MGWFKRDRKVRFFNDVVVLRYSDLERGKQWWIETFECKQVPMPDWDDPLPSDVAMQLPEDEDPVILLCSRFESGEVGGPDPRPMLFCSDIDKGHELLASRGVKPTPIEDAVGPRHFDIEDPEGQTIEICEDI